jgi:hypothetical protein
MNTLDIYLNLVQQEGIGSTLMCKQAKIGIKMNTKNYLNPSKEGLSNCKQFKESNPSKYKDCRQHFQARIDMTQRAIDRGKKVVEKYCKKES